MLAAETPITFGYFGAALLATAAVALAAAVQSALIASRTRNDRTVLYFGVLCLSVAVIAAARAVLYATSSLDTAILALRFIAGAGLVAFPALMLFVAGYTRRPTSRTLRWAILLLSAVLFVVNLVAPYTVLDSTLYFDAPLVLPWGESLQVLDGTRSLTGQVYFWYSYFAFAWALYRGVRQYRDGQHRRATLLLICLLIQSAAVLWSLLLVSTLSWRYPSTDAFAFLSFVLLMGSSLVGRLHDHALRLERTTAALRAEAATREQAEHELRHAASHDALTGLPNRTGTMTRLAQLVADARQAKQFGAVLMLDLDNFKTINDSLGHHVGDLVLDAVAKRLRAALPHPAVVARLGGDEFCMLLPATDDHADAAATRALKAAGSVLAHLSPVLELERRMLPVGASIGIATYPAGQMHATDIVRRADIALYQAKRAGRNTVRQFELRMQKEADTRLELERGLREAAAHRELALYYQPQVDMAGRVVGAEGLLRWHHPVLGDVSPATFIPIAEASGLIHALGEWAITTACRDLRSWRTHGVDHDVHLSINVSAWQLANPNFVDILAARVQAEGVEPAALTLELTESALLGDFETARQALQRLSDIGFRLSLDDFGTGYSSLAYLQRLPMDELKIDYAFVNALKTNHAHPLAGFIVDIGRRLGLVTVAEGVETVAQRDLLRAMGCDRIQGFLASPALAPDAFRAWLDRGTAIAG